jgi:hypothetical protein
MWFTFHPEAYEFGRQTLLRIFWDDESEPSVLSPLGDFFCVPFGLTGKEYRIDSYFISLAPRNGLNCYFPMPFARRAVVQVLLPKPSPGGFYFQADYQLCPQGLPAEWEQLRFHAHYRMENPTETYGHNYLILDAEGSGYVVGTSCGIRRRQEQPDVWCHGGGDSIYIDGETNPHILHGIGAEDFFGHSWGVETYSGSWIGAPYVHWTAPGEPFHDLVLYRFFYHDPLRFESSMRQTLGAMGDSINSVAYWYQTEPHRPFFRLPEGAELSPAATVPRLSNDLPLEYEDGWRVFGPLANAEVPFAETLPLEVREEPGARQTYMAGSGENRDTMEVVWKLHTAPRGFLDFNEVMRPRLRTIQLQTGCYAYAVGYVEVPEEMETAVRIGFDDHLRLRVNDAVVLDEEHSAGFAVSVVPVRLRAGRNRILVKLSNEHNTTWRAWVFHLAFVDRSGQRLSALKIRPLGW